MGVCLTGLPLPCTTLSILGNLTEMLINLNAYVSALIIDLYNNETCKGHLRNSKDTLRNSERKGRNGPYLD